MYHVKINFRCKFFLLIITIIFQMGCKKFLEEIPDKTLTVPKNLDELQAVLDNENNNLSYPIAAELAADNISFTLDDWNYMFFEDDRNIYIWEPSTDLIRDWDPAYKTVFMANVVLSEIDKLEISEGQRDKYNSIKGSALFFRSFTFLELAQVFAPPYSSANASLPYGIPLKMSPGIDDKTVRSTIKDTYEKIVADLKESCWLLPASISYKSRPSRTAAYALLARTLLLMNDYVNAGKYADSCLQLYNDLLDYNDPTNVNLTGRLSFKRFNDEVIFNATTRDITELLRSKVNLSLVAQYQDHDLRKQVFFTESPDGNFQFKGSYDGSSCSKFFCGLSTNEMFLVRAEAKARESLLKEALEDLNILLSKRWVTGTFVPYTTANVADPLRLILEERRKELCFRPSLRWGDLRRLNLQPGFEATIVKQLDGQTFSLPPNDKRYTFLIPEDVIARSGIGQNPR